MSINGKVIAISSNKNLLIWKFNIKENSWNLVKKFTLKNSINKMIFSDNGKILFSLSENQSHIIINIWNMNKC